MIGVGIDVAKTKSMVAILSDDGEIIKAPLEIANTETGLSHLCDMIKELDEDVFSVVESTSVYHFPVVSYLQKNGIIYSEYENSKKHHLYYVNVACCCWWYNKL